MTGRGAAPPRTEPATNEPVRTEPAATARPSPAPPGPAAPSPEPQPAAGRAAPAPTDPPDEPDSFIPDGVALGFGDIPEGFWDAPADEVRAALTTEAAPEPPGPPLGAQPPTPPATTPLAAVEPPSPSEEGEPPSPLEEAFNELQSLFPGRVVEVQPRGVEGADEAETSPLEDEFAPEGGYDDEGQERLSFGPQEDA